MPQQHNLGDLTKAYYSLNLTTPVWIAIDGLQNMDPPSVSFGSVDRKLLNGDFKEKRPGKAEGDDGTISLEYSGDNAFMTTVAGWVNAGRPPVVLLGVVFEDGSDITCPAFVTGLKPKDVDEDSQVGVDIGYQVAGKPAYHPVTAIAVTP